MSIWRRCIRIFAGGLAAALALGGAAPAIADVGSDMAVVPLPRPRPVPVPVLKVRRGVRVPAGILAGVASGSVPGGARLRTLLAPFPVGFAADPYYSPPAVAVVPPPIVFVPPPVVFAPPFLYDIEPTSWWFDGCFVPSDFAGQHGYFGSCAEAFYRQWASRPN